MEETREEACSAHKPGKVGCEDTAYNKGSRRGILEALEAVREVNVAKVEKNEKVIQMVRDNPEAAKIANAILEVIGVIL